jgi:hypothetical protein
MTDFQMSPSTAVTFENLEWDLTPPGQRKTLGGTLAISSLTAAQHFPNGYIASGLVVALATTGANSGLLVPYLNAATAGLGDVAAGILVHSVPVTRLVGGSNRAKIGVAFMVAGMVSVSKLPFTVGNAAAGGYLDAAARVDLPQIFYAA